MQVGIIGAGIGGLVTAIGLQRIGAQVTIFEKDSAPRPSGSGLSLFGNGWAALDAVGIGEAVRDIAGDRVTGLRAGQRTPDGRWLATTSAEAVRRLRIVHRADLHRVLTEAIKSGSIRYGHRVTAVNSTHGTIATIDAQGTQHLQTFDTIVGADGIHSTVRASWPRDPGTRYSGYSTWRGITNSAVDLTGAAGETWGRGLRFGYAPLRDGRIYWFGVATMPHETVIDDEYAHVSRLFGGWHDPIPAIVAATDPEVVFRLPIEDLARPLWTFRRGATVLVGDAAHAMTPDLGQGGNQAMEDAATLAALLAPLAAVPAPARADVERALAKYDRLRRERTQPIAKRSRAVGRVAQVNGGTAASMRDLALRALPSSAADSQLETIQSWRPPIVELADGARQR